MHLLTACDNIMLMKNDSKIVSNRNDDRDLLLPHVEILATAKRSTETSFRIRFNVICNAIG